MLDDDKYNDVIGVGIAAFGGFLIYVIIEV